MVHPVALAAELFDGLYLGSLYLTSLVQEYFDRDKEELSLVCILKEKEAYTCGVHLLVVSITWLTAVYKDIFSYLGHLHFVIELSYII